MMIRVHYSKWHLAEKDGLWVKRGSMTNPIDQDKQEIHHATVAPADRPVRPIGYLFGLVAAFLYCSQGPATKLLLQGGYSSFEITGLLFVLGAVAINAYVLGRREIEAYREAKRHPLVFLIMGSVYFGAYLFYFVALKYLNVGWRRCCSICHRSSSSCSS